MIWKNPNICHRFFFEFWQSCNLPPPPSRFPWNISKIQKLNEANIKQIATWRTGCKSKFPEPMYRTQCFDIFDQFLTICAFLKGFFWLMGNCPKCNPKRVRKVRFLLIRTLPALCAWRVVILRILILFLLDSWIPIFPDIQTPPARQRRRTNSQISTWAVSQCTQGVRAWRCCMVGLAAAAVYWFAKGQTKARNY